MNSPFWIEVLGKAGMNIMVVYSAGSRIPELLRAETLVLDAGHYTIASIMHITLGQY